MLLNRKKPFVFFVYVLVVTFFALLYLHLLSEVIQAHPPLDPPPSCDLTINVVGNGSVSSSLDSDMNVEIGLGTPPSYVILENSQLKVKYASFTPSGSWSQFAIKQFTIKSVNQDQVGNGTYQYLGADAGRGALAAASIIYDGPDRKTVRLEWNKKDDSNPSNRIIHEVSIFPNRRFLKIDYINVEKGLNIVDLGKPGGVSNGTHWAYNHAAWMAHPQSLNRGYITHQETDPPVVGSYYNRYSGDGVNDPADGGPLNYNNHFIVGVYNPDNGRGFGRVLPITDTSIIKLLLEPDSRNGLEFFPHPFYQPHSPFTGYLYGVTGGETELLSLGQQVVDQNYNQTGYQCGDDVYLTAIPDSGWVFTNWDGDISGTTNPGILSLTANHVVTATFEPDTTPPVIDVWYGSNQNFGQVGTPQQWLNILGNVSDAESGVTSLVYSLNGVPGPVVGGIPGQLTIGPHPDASNRRRLFFEGDFNIDIDKDVPNLIDGANTVVITATNGEGLQSVETVTVNYQSGNIWPLPYSIDWSTGIANAQDVLQIVDGLWTWDTSGIRTDPSGVAYDRVLNIGDMSWDNYEVTVPITINGVDTSAYSLPASAGPGMGVNLRWQGHTDEPAALLNPPCLQPKCGWAPTGSSNWYEWRQDNNNRLHIFADPSSAPANQPRQLETGKTYWFKARANTLPSGRTHYSVKVWENGQGEPQDWDLDQYTDPGNLTNGSFLLVAHHVDATFGNITVTPPNPIYYDLSTSSTGNGSITAEPNQPGPPYNYEEGTVVTLTATAEEDWTFSSWGGDLSGSTNPVTVSMYSDKTIVANFSENDYQTFLPLIIGDN